MVQVIFSDYFVLVKTGAAAFWMTCCFLMLFFFLWSFVVLNGLSHAHSPGNVNVPLFHQVRSRHVPSPLPSLPTHVSWASYWSLHSSSSISSCFSGDKPQGSGTHLAAPITLDSWRTCVTPLAVAGTFAGSAHLSRHLYLGMGYTSRWQDHSNLPGNNSGGWLYSAKTLRSCFCQC